MIPTKTYPLYAIMGGEISDKERIAELADAFNRVCAENADFVAQSVTDEERIAKLEAQVKHCEGHAAELEAEVRAVATMEAYAVCAEICQEESTDNGTAQKIEARIRALQPERRKGERRDPPYYGESARWLNPLAWERTGKDRRQAK